MIAQFQIGPLVDTAKYYDKVNQFDHDVPFYLEMAKATEGRVLELFSGTGRVALAIARTGKPILGVEKHASMLNGANAKRDTLELFNARFLLEDARTVELNKQFSLITAPYNAVQIMFRDDDVRQLLRNVRKHLAPEGRFVFDINNPDFEELRKGLPEFTLKYAFTTDDGESVEIFQKQRYEPETKCNRIVRRFVIDGETVEQPLDMRVFSPEDIQSLLKEAGFTLESCFGNFDRSSLTSESPKQIIVCR